MLVVTKSSIRESNTEYAQGGIAAVLGQGDSVDSHIADTMRAGAGLCDERVVREIVTEGPDRVRELISWGGEFDRADGEVLLTREGGHSERRVAHAGGDKTGHELMNTLIRKIRGTEIRIWEEAFLIDLITEGGECLGALVNARRGGRRVVWAGAVVLTTGGGCRIFRESTNPPVATGDGIAAAWRAGVAVRDMEFVQFHPTVLYIAGAERKLVSEAVRGEGATLTDRSGRRFMVDRHPDAELAPRDIVARSIDEEMRRTGAPHVLLDLTHLDREYIRRRFPGLTATCDIFGIDPSRTGIPVRPAAHYFMGGVAVDLRGRTNVTRLLAAGEATASGLHGANRLGSNSLLEGLVLGVRAGDEAGRIAAGIRGTGLRHGELSSPDRASGTEPLDIVDLVNSLSALINRSAGIVRKAAGLRSALEVLDSWSTYVHNRRFDKVSGWELQNMLTLSRLVVRGALEREESRGAHTREDFPARDDRNWRGHLTQIRGEGCSFRPLVAANEV